MAVRPLASAIVADLAVCRTNCSVGMNERICSRLALPAWGSTRSAIQVAPEVDVDDVVVARAGEREIVAQQLLYRLAVLRRERSVELADNLAYLTACLHAGSPLVRARMPIPASFVLRATTA